MSDNKIVRINRTDYEALVEDKAALDWLEAQANSAGGLLLHDGSETGRRGLGLRLRSLRAAIQAARGKR